MYEIRPVSSAGYADLDTRRLRDDFVRVRVLTWPADVDSQWTLLLNSEFLVASGDLAVPTLKGMLLFGKDVKRFAHRAAIGAQAYTGDERDYSASERTTISGALTGLYDDSAGLVEAGIIEESLHFVAHEVTKEVLRDYRYTEASGLGIPYAGTVKFRFRLAACRGLGGRLGGVLLNRPT